MKIDPLDAISPIDGRYRSKVGDLSKYYSEYALIKYRTKIEVLYLMALADVGVVRKLTNKEKKLLHSLYNDFTLHDASRVKRIEKKIRHDLKHYHEKIFQR